MPRCQRTFRRLPEGRTAPGAGGVPRWECACCPHSPAAYEAVRDPDLLSFAALAGAACVRDFGAPDDAARPSVLLLGLRPECVYEPDERRYDIYLAQGSGPWDLRLQIGHEVFHRTCSQGRVFHWSHEMLACLVSVRLLRRLGGAGAEEYAAATDARYRAEADGLPLSELLAVDPFASADYPPGYYGRAYVTGLDLIDAAGWPALCRLARRLNRASEPDVAGWLSSLPTEAEGAARAALAPVVQ